MNRAMKAGALAAGIGFFVMVFLLVLHVRSPLIVNALWPTHFFENSRKGGFLALVFRTAGFFANAFLYGLIGYGIGRLLYGNEPPEKPSR